jgi:hypothetical protein
MGFSSLNAHLAYQGFSASACCLPGVQSTRVLVAGVHFAGQNVDLHRVNYVVANLNPFAYLAFRIFITRKTGQSDESW